MLLRVVKYEEELERFYLMLEKVHYEFELDTISIFNYTIKQTGYVGEVKPFYTWLHYLELAREFGVEEKMPKHLVVDYNIVREKAGLNPIIYELHNMYTGDYVARHGNRLRMDGTFLCDKNKNPILKWIGVRIKNAKKIWVM